MVFHLYIRTGILSYEEFLFRWYGINPCCVCPQVWMLVQRKWMYLESIFIGGDIRSQLPEEAKKFDNIDRTFKKVSLPNYSPVIPPCVCFSCSPTELKCKFGRLKCVCGFGKQIMADSVKDPGIKRCCLVPNRLVDLQALSDGLERCQKSLNDYLDSKRNAFPRFFFISDDELLSILGSSEPTCVQEHIIKVISVLFSTEYSS